MEKQKWPLKKEDTFAKLKKSNSTVKEMKDLLPGRSISQIKAKLVQMGFSSKKIDKTHEIDSKEIKNKKLCIFDLFQKKISFFIVNDVLKSMLGAHSKEQSK